MKEDNSEDLWCHYSGMPSPSAYTQEEKEMNKEEAKDELIKVLYSQVTDLSMMSKIELGDDVIAEIKRLQDIIHAPF